MPGVQQIDGKVWRAGSEVWRGCDLQNNSVTIQCPWLFPPAGLAGFVESFHSGGRRPSAPQNGNSGPSVAQMLPSDINAAQRQIEEQYIRSHDRQLP